MEILSTGEEAVPQNNLGVVTTNRGAGAWQAKPTAVHFSISLSSSVSLSSRSLSKTLNKTGLTTGATGSPPGVPLTMFIITDNCSFAFSQVLASDELHTAASLNFMEGVSFHERLYRFLF